MYNFYITYDHYDTSALHCLYYTSDKWGLHLIGQCSSLINSRTPISPQLVIVPSQRDAACNFVYPQPPPDLKITSPTVTFASDPCVLEVNGVSLAMTSTDVLFHLSSEEVC